jgi:hypothetical protein
MTFRSGWKPAGMVEGNFPTIRCFHQDKALHESHVPLASNHRPAGGSIRRPDTVQRHRDPSRIAAHLRHRILRVIVDVNAGIFVGLIGLPQAGFGGSG